MKSESSGRCKYFIDAYLEKRPFSSALEKFCWSQHTIRKRVPLYGLTSPTAWFFKTNDWSHWLDDKNNFISREKPFWEMRQQFYHLGKNTQLSRAILVSAILALKSRHHLHQLHQQQLKHHHFSSNYRYGVSSWFEPNHLEWWYRVSHGRLYFFNC